MHAILELRSIEAPRRKPGDLPPVNPSLRDGLTAARSIPRGFTLTELLVVIGIVLVLMGLLSAAVAGARGSQKKQATQSLIAKLDAIIDQQFATYASRSVPTTALTGPSKSASRAAYLRKLVSAEMPDSWEDVKAIISGSAGVPRTAPQNAYVGVYQSITPSPSAKYADAECLFMIVMQGGLVDCLDCGELRLSEKGDTDSDGAFEFLDDWGEPIRYVLWPAGFELPPSSGKYFSITPPFSAGFPVSAKGGTMRPLIFSGGADKTNAILVNGGGCLKLGDACGDPSHPDVATLGSLDTSGADARADNITNFDTEVAK
jgi:prepilin-type N-terminal cleavage/methylation domain-containing protein